MTSDYELNNFEIIFNKECEKCNTDFDDENFEYDNVDICKSCMKNIKNKCETCGGKCQFNFEEFEYGVRCIKHKEEGMVNTSSKEYCERRFVKRIEKLGGRVTGEYTRNDIGVSCICKQGHICNPIPNSIRSGNGMCKICAKNDPKTSKINFITTIEEKLNGKVMGEYKGCDTPVACICKYRHICNPTPHSIQQGQGMCLICVKRDSETSKQNFINTIEVKFGGKVIGEYIKNNIPIECICKYGHNCNPTPHSIQQGQGMCNRCSQSGGEIFISHVLEKLNISYDTEVNNDLIKNKFRFDFRFEYNNIKYYLEYDGNQHFKYSSLFHKSTENFTIHQQKDLYKNYISKKSNIKIIRIAQPQIKNKTVDEFSLYLKLLIENNTDKDIIVDHELYDDWIFQEPSTETIEMYDN
jgi:hypothetical protein